MGIQGLIEIADLAFVPFFVETQLDFTAAKGTGFAPADTAAVRICGTAILFSTLFEFPTIKSFFGHNIIPHLSGKLSPI